MTKIVEDRHPGESWLSWKLGNLTAIDEDLISTIGFAWGFKEQGKWNWKPRKTGNVSLFYNAVFFIRFSWPFGIQFMVRWAETGTRAYLQAGLGYKANGRLGGPLRIQGDAASAAGVSGPNVGQAQGFEYGTH